MHDIDRFKNKLKPSKENIAFVFAIIIMVLIIFIMMNNHEFNSRILGPFKKEIRELHLAAITNDIPTLKSWLDKEYDVDASYVTEGTWHQSGTTGTTALILAASNGNYDAVKLLVDAGANLYAQTRDSHIHFEMDKQHEVFDVIDNDNKKSKLKYYYTGRSAFDAAISGGHLEIAKLLWFNSDKIIYKMKGRTHFISATADYCRKNNYKKDDFREMIIFLANNVISKKTISVRLTMMRDKDCAKEINKILNPVFSQSERTVYLEKLYSVSHEPWLLRQKERGGEYTHLTKLRIYNSFLCSKDIADSENDHEYIYEKYCEHFIKEKKQFQEFDDKWPRSPDKQKHIEASNKTESVNANGARELTCNYYDGYKRIIKYKIDEVFEYCGL